MTVPWTNYTQRANRLRKSAGRPLSLVGRELALRFLKAQSHGSTSLGEVTMRQWVCRGEAYRQQSGCGPFPKGKVENETQEGMQKEQEGQFSQPSRSEFTCSLPGRGLPKRCPNVAFRRPGPLSKVACSCPLSPKLTSFSS